MRPQTSVTGTGLPISSDHGMPYAFTIACGTRGEQLASSVWVACIHMSHLALVDAEQLSAVERVDVHPITRLARRPRREEEVARQPCGT